MESAMVIKVKYGEMLRRFSVSINENDQLDLNMDGLKAKIFCLFNFGSDLNIALTYIDEDGDKVALVDDEDLLDVTRQCLKFLRIDVHLIKDKGSIACVRPSGSSANSPQGQHLNGNVSGVSKILKSVPEPLPEELSKLCLELTYKALSSTPLIAELVQCFSTMGAHPDPSAQSLAPQSPVTQKAAVDLKASDNDVLADASANSKPMDMNSKSCHKVEIGNVDRGPTDDVSPTTPVRASVDLNLLPIDSIPVGCAVVNTDTDSPCCSGTDTKEKTVAGEDYSMTRHGQNMRDCAGSGRKVKSTGNDAFSRRNGGGMFSTFVSPMNFGAGASGTDMNASEGPNSGVTLPDDSSVSLFGAQPIKKSITEISVGIFHKGIICDICGVHPITGPRFKSKVKENYDLCTICFAEVGNEADYIRIDRPIISPSPPRLSKGCRDQRPWTSTRSVKHTRPKLNSRLILDINIPDCTLVAPSAVFTKIWRMRNNGTLAWPRGTQLLSISGKGCGSAVSGEIEIPADGVAVDKELDIAVDFMAPALPGRYISYWRMASPAGQKFGPTLLARIQVDDSRRGSLTESTLALNLNLLPESSGSKGLGAIDINVKPAEDGDYFQPCNFKILSILSKPVLPRIKQRRNEPVLTFPARNGVPAGQKVLASSAVKASSAAASPIVDAHGLLTKPCYACAPSFSKVDVAEFSPIPPSPALLSATPFPGPFIDAHTSALKSMGMKYMEMKPVEENPLGDLNETSFDLTDLSPEYDMEQLVNDLLKDDPNADAEWDRVLKDLQEMGFCDREMNRKLLMKHNGSILHVVMDLLVK